MKCQWVSNSQAPLRHILCRFYAHIFIVHTFLHINNLFSHQKTLSQLSFGPKNVCGKSVQISPARLAVSLTLVVSAGCATTAAAAAVLCGCGPSVLLLCWESALPANAPLFSLSRIFLPSRVCSSRNVASFCRVVSVFTARYFLRPNDSRLASAWRHTHIHLFTCTQQQQHTAACPQPKDVRGTMIPKWEKWKNRELFTLVYRTKRKK